MEERLEYLKSQLSSAIADFERGLAIDARALDIRNPLSHIYRKESFLALHEEIANYRGFFGLAAAAMTKERE